MVEPDQPRVAIPQNLGPNHALPEMRVELWVASHADLADVPRIKAVREMLFTALAKDRDLTPAAAGDGV